jgi:predicted RNA binding protein YcfA (HicA-like mRNA interferase family)
MPKWPVVGGADVVRALERLGFAKVRQRGSHVVMRRGSVGCVVPMHDPIKTGTLAGVVRQAQVAPDVFLEVLGK